jgi:hypothetical protein
MENTTKRPTERPEDRAFGVETVKPTFGKKGFGNLLKMYFYRLTHDKIAYAILIIIFAMALIAVLFGWDQNEQAKRTAQLNGTEVQYQFSLSMIALSCFSTPNQIVSTLFMVNLVSVTDGFQSLIQSVFNTILPIGFISLIYISSFFGREWHNRTLRNQILSGHSRFQIYLASFVATLLWCLAGTIIWQIVVWGLGGALQVPAFLKGQFYSDAYGTNYSYPGIMAISFFMEMLIYVTFAMIALSWVYIIGNSWGALGLFAATIFAFDVFFSIIFGIGRNHNNTYFQFMECLLPYQNAAFLNYDVDIAAKYVVQTSEYGNSFTLKAEYGRALPLILKTVFSSIILVGGFGGLGYLAFYKKDLK